MNQYQLQTLLTRSRDVIGLTQMAICRALVALARIWREILKLIRFTFPFLGIYRRVAFDSYIGPGFCVISVELEPLLGSVLGVGLDRFDRTFRLTYPTIDAFVGMDDEHVFALVETIDGANLHAIHQLALDAGFIDDISQMSSSLWQRQPLVRFAYAEVPPQAYFAVSGMGMLSQIKPKRCSVRRLKRRCGSDRRYCCPWDSSVLLGIILEPSG